MKRILNFLQSNKLAVICIAVCIIISTSAAGDKIRREKQYIEDLSVQLSNAATGIHRMTTHFVDSNGNIEREFRQLREDLIELNMMQYVARVYVDRRFCHIESYWYISSFVCDVEKKEGFLDRSEIEFLEGLRADLQDLAVQLDGYKDSFLFVDIKEVNRLIEEFDRKYNGNIDSLKSTYKNIMDVYWN